MHPIFADLFGISIPSPGKILGGVVNSVAGDAITALAKAIVSAIAHVIGTVASFWTAIPSPQVADGAGNPTGAVAVIQANLAWYVGAVAVAGILIGTVRILWHEHKSHHTRELAKFVITYVMITAVIAGLAALLVQAMDGLTGQLVNHALGNQSFENKLETVLGLTGSTQDTAGSLVGLAGSLATAILAIFIGLIALLSSLLEIVLMFVRSAMLVLLCGVIPLAAAASNTELGQQWLKKSIAWLLAFALYKPAAAVIYLAAFALPANSGITGLLQGATMLMLAILALPALMRFLVPATAHVAGGPGAGAMIGGTAASAAMFVGRSDSGAGPTGAASSGYHSAAPSGGESDQNGGGPSGATPTGAGGGGGDDGSDDQQHRRSGGGGGFPRGGGSPKGPAGGGGAEGAAVAAA